MAIEKDGKIYRNLPEQVEYNSNEIENLKAVISAFGNVMRYCGSVDTYADLPEDGNRVGDVWNVLDTGNNYAWDGEAWDEISSIVDLSGYVEKINVPRYQTNVAILVNPLTNINGKVLETYSAELVGEYQDRYVIKRNGEQCSLEDAIEYINRMTGTTYVPTYNYDYPRNSYWVFSDGSIWKPQYAGNDLNEKMVLWRIPVPYLLTSALTGIINPNSSGYGLRLPSTSGFTDNQTIATKDDLDGAITTFKASNNTWSGSNTFNDVVLGYAKLTNNVNYLRAVDVATSQLILYATNSYMATRSLRPMNHNTYDLGQSATNAYRDLYLSGTIHVGAYDTISDLGAGSLLLHPTLDVVCQANAIRPFNNNATDLGGPSHKYKDLYLAGNLTDGTYTVTVAQLAALATPTKLYKHSISGITGFGSYPLVIISTTPDLGAVPSLADLVTLIQGATRTYYYYAGITAHDIIYSSYSGSTLALYYMGMVGTPPTAQFVNVSINASALSGATYTCTDY